METRKLFRVQFQQVRGRRLFVCLGLLQAKNSQLGKARLPTVQKKNPVEHTSDLQSKHTATHTELQLGTCFNTNQSAVLTPNTERGGAHGPVWTV